MLFTFETPLNNGKIFDKLITFTQIWGGGIHYNQKNGKNVY